eukprot:6802039-Ditylum_brightwellii.AAC.1
MSFFEIVHHPQCEELFSTTKRNDTTHLCSCKAHPIAKSLLAKYETMHACQTWRVNAGISPPIFVPEPSSYEEEVPPPRSTKDISRLREPMRLSQKGTRPIRRKAPSPSKVPRSTTSRPKCKRQICNVFI